MKELLAIEWFGNTLLDYGASLATFLSIWLLLVVVVKIILAQLKRLAIKTKTTIDEFLIEQIRNIHCSVYVFVALFFATKNLAMLPAIEKAIYILFVAALTIAAIKVLVTIIGFSLNQKAQQKYDDEAAADASTKTILNLIKYVLWIGGAIFLLDNINMSERIAGLYKASQIICTIRLIFQVF